MSSGERGGMNYEITWHKNSLQTPSQRAFRDCLYQHALYLHTSSQEKHVTRGKKKLEQFVRKKNHSQLIWIPAWIPALRFQGTSGK